MRTRLQIDVEVTDLAALMEAINQHDQVQVITLRADDDPTRNIHYYGVLMGAQEVH
jgi:hypothetical protein